MTTAEVALELVELCKQGKALEARALYSEDIVSVESRVLQHGSREIRGLEGVLGKAHWFMANNEVHSQQVEGLLVAGAHFCVHFIYDTTFKPTGVRTINNELGVYEVKDGKIIREEFFYEP